MLIVIYPNYSFASYMSKKRVVVVHQTSKCNAESIFAMKKILPFKGSRGKGIYACYDAPTTNHKCQGGKGTYLIIDFYLGNSKKNINLDNYSTYDSTINTEFNGDEYVVRDSNRALNFRYLKGDKPSNMYIEMRPRMTLIFATTQSEAKQIIEKQELPKENHPDIADVGYYLWSDIPSASKFGNSGNETLLIADVFFTNPFENKKYFPSRNDYMNYDSFRGVYKEETCYFMVKYPQRIKNIRYIDGKRP